MVGRPMEDRYRKKDTGRRHKMFGQIKGKLEFFSVSFLSG